MQPYSEHLPIGDPELVPDDAAEWKARMQELLDSGADEIKVFRPSDPQLNAMLKAKGMNREQRRKWIKERRGQPPLTEGTPVPESAK